MRQQRGVRCGEQCLGHVRFMGEDIEPGGGDGAVGQRGGKGLLIDGTAATDVDEDAVRADRISALTAFAVDAPPGATEISVSTASASPFNVSWYS